MTCKPAAFICPKDRAALLASGECLVCTRCQTAYPLVNGVPVLINDTNSVFHIADYTSSDVYQGASGYDGATDQTSGLRRAYRRFARRLMEGEVLNTESINRIFMSLDSDPTQRILIIGAGEHKTKLPATRTDVAFSPNLDCICDAHDLPFADASFDIVYVLSVWSTSATLSVVSAKLRGSLAQKVASSL